MITDMYPKAMLKNLFVTIITPTSAFVGPNEATKKPNMPLQISSPGELVHNTRIVIDAPESTNNSFQTRSFPFLKRPEFFLKFKDKINNHILPQRVAATIYRVIEFTHCC